MVSSITGAGGGVMVSSITGAGGGAMVGCGGSRGRGSSRISGGSRGKSEGVGGVRKAGGSAIAGICMTAIRLTKNKAMRKLVFLTKVDFMVVVWSKRY
jgi:hypothetical protein